jgi:hypothetical protein
LLQGKPQILNQAFVHPVPWMRFQILYSSNFLTTQITWSELLTLSLDSHKNT